MSFAVPAHLPPVPPQQTVVLSHGKLSFRSCGDGETVLFLHGLLGNSKSWTFQLDAFARKYRAVAWDAPGFGGSDRVAVSIDAYVEALHEFIVSLGCAKLFLVGHSMGGTVAARYAAKHPETVSRLVLSCTHPGYGDPQTAPMSEKFENRMRELAQIGAQAYGLKRARDLLPGENPAHIVELAAEVAAEVSPEGLRRATRMLQLADNRPLLPKLRMPVLVLTGGNDTVVQPRLSADLLRLTPLGKHVEMPGLAHAPYFQSPDYYNALIQDFLSE